MPRRNSAGPEPFFSGTLMILCRGERRQCHRLLGWNLLQVMPVPAAFTTQTDSKTGSCPFISIGFIDHGLGRSHLRSRGSTSFPALEGSNPASRQRFGTVCGRGARKRRSPRRWRPTRASDTPFTSKKAPRLQEGGFSSTNLSKSLSKEWGPASARSRHASFGRAAPCGNFEHEAPFSAFGASGRYLRFFTFENGCCLTVGPSCDGFGAVAVVNVEVDDGDLNVQLRFQSLEAL